MKSVLVFKPGSIGDCLMAKYFLENVRNTHPEARYAVAVSVRVKMVRNLFAAYPWIEVIEANRRSLWGLLRGGRHDFIVTPYTGGVFPLRSKIVARFLASTLIGYSDTSSFNRFLYNKVIPLVGRSRAPRLLECDALRALGLPVVVEKPTFNYLSQPGLLSRLGLQENKYVVVQLFSGSDARGLSPERKRALINVLGKILPVPLVLNGLPDEISKLSTLPAGVLGATTTLQELAHLIDHSAAMVSLDTGAAHIAAHLRKPLVVLASCIQAQWWSESMYGKDARTLFTCPEACPHGHDYSGYAKCLDAIDVDAVAAQAARLLSVGTAR